MPYLFELIIPHRHGLDVITSEHVVTVCTGIHMSHRHTTGADVLLLFKADCGYVGRQQQLQDMQLLAGAHVEQGTDTTTCGKHMLLTLADAYNT